MKYISKKTQKQTQFGSLRTLYKVISNIEVKWGFLKKNFEKKNLLSFFLCFYAKSETFTLWVKQPKVRLDPVDNLPVTKVCSLDHLKKKQKWNMMVFARLLRNCLCFTAQILGKRFFVSNKIFYSVELTTFLTVDILAPTFEPLF